ncbi:MAG TPA: TonB-dependent siderophore receptor [Gemmatimonadales bacterium]|nr:TonB-dependent siderophore receptor [Gemmatimonadales bacterium]
MSKRRSPSKQKARKQAPRRPAPAPARPAWTFIGALAASAAFGGLATPAFAQEPAAPPGRAQAAIRDFDIPAGSLRTAIEQFARTTGLVVTDPQSLVGELFSPGVTGSYSDEDALRVILGATGVTYRYTSARSLRLEPVRLPGYAAGVDTLPTIAVEGSRERVSSPKYSSPLRDVPQSITIVPQAVIEAQGATSLRDVVRNVPGLTVNAGEGGATPGDNFNLRGFTARGDIFVDGVRTEGGYSRETFNVEQVEVTKGPGSAYIGRGSTGGAINLVTKTPRLAPAYGFSASVGTADFQHATADVNRPVEIGGLPGAAVRLNAEWQDAGTAGLDRVEKNTWGVAPSVAVGLGTATQLTIDYLHAEQDNTPSYGVQSQNTDGPPAEVDTRRFFGLSALDFERVNGDRANARVEHRFSETLSLRNQLSWGNEDVRRVVTFANLDGTRATRSHITVDENVTSLTNLSAELGGGPVRHSVSAGLEVSHESSYFGSYRFSAPPPATDLDDPNPDDPYAGTLTEAPPRRDASANSVALYALETMRVGRHLEVSAGLRWDYFDPTYRDTLGADIAVPGGSESDAVSWRAGLVYKPAEAGSVYFAYGTSFNPSGERLAYDATGVTGLDPEKNRSYELGTKWDLVAGRLSTTAAVFRTEKTNARIDDPSDPLGQRQVLAGRQRVDGAEVGVNGSPVPGWSVFAGYTYLDSEILTSDDALDVGTPLPNTPKHALNLWTTYRLPWELEIGAGARHIGRRVLSRTASVPPYWSFDAEASYPVSPRVLLRLNLYNLTDEIYYDHGRFWVPSPGRSVRLSTSVQY